jgi:hypothetical protein
MKGDIIATCSQAEHAKRPSDDLGLEHRSPVGQPLPQNSISHLSRFFISQRFNDFECEAVRAVIAPGLLKTSVWVLAHAQREPDAVLNGVQVRALAEPGLTRTGTLYLAIAAFLSSPFIRLPRFPAPSNCPKIDIRAAAERSNYYTGNIACIFIAGYNLAV